MAVLPGETVCGIHQLKFGAILVLCIQIVYIILFGIFARYDDDALPYDGKKKIDDSEIKIYPTNLNFSVASTITLQCILFVLNVAFFEYDSLADASDKRNSQHHTEGGFNIETESIKLKRNYNMFMDTHVMIFVGFGFLMTFIKRYSFGGVAFNFLVGAMIVQWALLSNGFYSLDDNYRIPINLGSLISADIASAAVLISMGAVLGRTTYIQLLVMGICEIAIYSANNYLAQSLWKVSDAGASIFVHTFGAYFGLAVSYVLNFRRPEDGEHDFESSYTSDTFAMIGSLFLWIFWPSFNAAEVTGDSQHRAIINTYISLSACCVTTFVLSYVLSSERKFDMVHIQNSTLAGGVAIGATADLMVQPWGAALVGTVAACVSVMGYTTLSPWLARRFRLPDTCGVHNLHGMPGVLAGIVSAIMAAVATQDLYHLSLYQHYKAMAPKNASEMHDVVAPVGDGRSPGQQAGFQLIALGVTLVVAIVGGLVTGVIVKKLYAEPETQKNKDDNFWVIEHEEKPAVHLESH